MCGRRTTNVAYFPLHTRDEHMMDVLELTTLLNTGVQRLKIMKEIENGDIVVVSRVDTPKYVFL